MDIATIILLILLGLLMLLLELLVIPGATITGIAGAGMLVGAIYLTYCTYGTSAGHLTVLGTIVFLFLTFVFALKSNTWKRLMLSKKIESKATEETVETLVHIGDTGKSISRLAPMGKALINGNFIEVKAENILIDENQDIEVVKIEQNQIIVKLLNT